MTDIEQLQALANALAEDYPDRYCFRIEHRGGAFWAIPDEPRYLGDDGECLGVDIDVAERVLEGMY